MGADTHLLYKNKKNIALQAPALVWELGKDNRVVDGALLTLFVASDSHPKGELLVCLRFSDDDNHHDPIT